MIIDYTVTQMPCCSDQSVIFRIVKFLAQRLHMRSNGLDRSRSIGAPQPLQHRLGSKPLIGVLHQKLENGDLLEGQLDLLPPPGDPVGRGIEFDIANAQDLTSPAGRRSKALRRAKNSVGSNGLTR